MAFHLFSNKNQTETPFRPPLGMLGPTLGVKPPLVVPRGMLDKCETPLDDLEHP